MAQAGIEPAGDGVAAEGEHAAPVPMDFRDESGGYVLELAGEFFCASLGAKFFSEKGR